MIVRIATIALFCFAYGVNASELDSLKNIYTIASDDSLKARACLAIGDYFENVEVNQAIVWGNKAIAHARSFGDQKFIATALNYSSTYYNSKGDYHQQIVLCMKALKIAEKYNYMEQQGTISSNIGSAYVSLGDDKQAIYWLKKAIDLKEKYSSKEKLAYSISILGAYYTQAEKYDSAAVQHIRALEIRRSLGDEEKMAINMGNLATTYIQMNKFREAKLLLDESLEIVTKADIQHSVTTILLNYSWLYERMGELSKAIAYADSSLSLSKKNDYLDLKYEAALLLAGLHSRSGNYKLAYENQALAGNFWQEMNEQEAAENLNELRTVYETEKFEGENMILKKDGELQAAAIGRQRLIIVAAVVGLLIMIVFIFYLNKWNREKKHANKMQEIQTKLVEKKNLEILDSIRYAKRIQTAILPQSKRFKESLPNSFVFYKPKDVVAGDFYWLEEKDGKVLFAAADCTGHGVPGAMVSVVCNNGLNRSVREHGLSDPGKILDRTREIIIEEFEKSEEEVNDGMDIALCSIIGNKLEYAGAHNPLWIIRNGELIEIKADKQPIGKFAHARPYSTHAVDLLKGDKIYLFSDGYADQFGGEFGKKFMSGNLKSFLLEISTKSMSQQVLLIQDKFDDWMGDLEQLDDVCIIGVEV